MLQVRNPFDADGECKAWCFFELCDYLNIECSSDQIVKMSKSVSYRLDFFEQNDVQVHCFMPPAAILFPKLLMSYLRRPSKISFSSSRFNACLSDIIQQTGKLCVMFEGAAFSIYGIEQVWPHSVFAIHENGKFKIVDGLTPSLYAEGFIKNIDQIDFFSLSQESGIIKTVFLRETL